MVEFPQTVSNLTAASSCLFELITGRNLILYLDDGMRKSVQQAVAVESSRGWRIAKEKASHKIDVVVALAQACYATITNTGRAPGDLGFTIGLDEEPRAEPLDPAEAWVRELLGGGD